MEEATSELIQSTAQMVDLAVSYINNTIFEEATEELIKLMASHGNLMDYSSDGNYFNVRFLGFIIWNSCDDPRCYNYDKDDYESLENFLENKVRSLVAILSTINKSN